MTEATQITMDNLERVAGVSLLLRIDAPGKKVVEWIKENRQDINRIIEDNGAILIRGLKILSSRQFGDILQVLFGRELMPYRFRSTPRTELRGNVYTATEYHASETIPQHNENSYTNRWPMRLGFLCLLPAAEGGETPIADSRSVYNAIRPDVREEFERRGIMYMRNYGDLDLPWSEVFQTSDRGEVEQYCRDNNIGFEWKSDKHLRTWQITPAAAEHPVTGDKVWFNQSHLFHMSGLREDVRKGLLEVMDEKDLPRNTYFGDGGPIPSEYLDHIREAYRNLELVFRWERYDIMLLDNMLFSHGRRPFSGDRQVLVGMS